jgi:hypothetical protein
LSKLKNTVYARMEETSFRSGAVFGAGAAAVSGTAIALAVILSGHGATTISAAGSSAPARSTQPASAPSASATASPSVTPSSTPVTRASSTASPRYVPASRVTPVTAAQTASQASPWLAHARGGRHRRPHQWTLPGFRGRPFPPFHPRGGPPAPSGGLLAHPGSRAGQSMWRPAGQPRF